MVCFCRTQDTRNYHAICACCAKETESSLDAIADKLGTDKEDSLLRFIPRLRGISSMFVADLPASRYNQLGGISKMDNIGQINDRQILYVSTRHTKNWADSLPTANWLALPIGHDSDSQLIDDLAKKCLDNNTFYVCTVGQQCEIIHDTFDHYIVQRRIDKGESIDKPDDFDSSPMTTWHNDFDEGFWFAVTTAYPTVNDEYIPVDKVVCIDTTENGEKQRLLDLISKINSGWLPPDSYSNLDSK